MIQTGIPQGSGGHIGPLPNLKDALDVLDACPPGVPNCTADANSTGQAAAIAYTGSTSVAANDLVLTIKDAPSGQPGLFYYGAGQVQVAFGNGFRCVSAAGTSLHRITPPIAVDSSGNAMQPLDYTQPPMNSSNGQVSPGATWNWQFWFRDPMGGGAAFNLSDGLSATFCP